MQPLLWFLLVPYFAVLKLNVPAGIGGSREFTNRGNAQLTLALILVWPLILLAPTTGRLGEAIHAHPYIFAVPLLAASWWLVAAWMTGDRERRYAATYNSLPRWRRFAFGLTIPAAMIVGLVLVAGSAPAKHVSKGQWTLVSCNDAASEMTADNCSN
jgi:uncharacterized membrane protein YfcA